MRNNNGIHGRLIDCTPHKTSSRHPAHGFVIIHQRWSCRAVCTGRRQPRRTVRLREPAPHTAADLHHKPGTTFAQEEMCSLHKVVHKLDSSNYLEVWLFTRFIITRIKKLWYFFCSCQENKNSHLKKRSKASDASSENLVCCGVLSPGSECME